MSRKRNLVAALTLLAVLAGCTGNGGFAFLSDSEAGSELDEGRFGNPTMNNYRVQTGQSARIDLNNRFTADVDSVVTFAFDSAQLDAAARAVLDRQANWMRQFPEARFRVYGHTDLVGSAAYNKRLGLRRADAVVDYLARRGISRSRLEAMVSFGETQPLIVTQGRERRNRRTVTEVSGFVAGHPNVLNGKYAAIIFREYVASAAPFPSEPAAALPVGPAPAPAANP